MSNLEHYFENLLFDGKDCRGDVNKNALTKEEQEAVEICAQYVIWSIFDGRDEFKNFIRQEFEPVKHGRRIKMSDLISRQAAIDALWKALYDYEDKTEKQFIESDELDINNWIQHRIFVQNMNDIDRQTIQNLPTIEAEPIVRCKDCVNFHKYGFKLEYTECKHFDCDVCEDGFCAWGERKDEVERNDNNTECE